MVRSWCLSMLVLGLTCTAARAEEPPAFARDARFKRPVSLSRERICLGELVERIRGLTGAPIEVDDGQAPVSGMPLTVHLEEQPVREVLAGLRELLATPYLFWSWEEKPDGSYRLRPSAAPSVAAARARKAASERFVADFRELCAAARGPEAQLEAQAKLHPEFLFSPRDYPDRLAFVRALTNQQVNKIVAGEKVELRAEELPAEARKVLRLGIISPLPPDQEPKSGSLEISWQGGSPAATRPRLPFQVTLGPVLWLQSNQGKTNFFGGVLWDRGWLRQIAPEWQASGSPVIQDWFKRRATEMKDPEPLTASSVAGITLEAARRRHLNLLVNFEGSASGQFASLPLPAATPDTPCYLVTYFNLTWKKQGELNLLRSKAAITNPAPLAFAWRALSPLRRALDRNQGYPDLPTLVKLSQLSEAELMELLPEFGGVNINTDQLRERGVWRAILSFYRLLPADAQKQLLAGKEVLFGKAPAEAKTALGDAAEAYHRMVVERLLKEGETAAVRFFIEPADIMAPGPNGRLLKEPGRQLVWEVRFPSGQVLRRLYPLQSRPASGDQL